MNAYNYETQQWEEGEAARATLKRQLAKELELLNGPRGEAFARSMKMSKPDAILRLQAQLNSL